MRPSYSHSRDPQYSPARIAVAVEEARHTRERIESRDQRRVSYDSAATREDVATLMRTQTLSS